MAIQFSYPKQSLSDLYKRTQSWWHPRGLMQQPKSLQKWAHSSVSKNNTKSLQNDALQSMKWFLTKGMAPTQPSFQTILKLLYGSDFLPKAYILLPVQYGKAHETPHKMACKMGFETLQKHMLCYGRWGQPHRENFNGDAHGFPKSYILINVGKFLKLGIATDFFLQFRLACSTGACWAPSRFVPICPRSKWRSNTFCSVFCSLSTVFHFEIRNGIFLVGAHRTVDIVLR